MLGVRTAKQAIGSIVQQFWQMDAAGEPGDRLAPELDDQIDWIGQGDIVRVIPFWATSGKDHFNARIERTNPEVQYAEVRRIGDGFMSSHTELYSIDELWLILKAKAAIPANAETAAL